MYRNTHPIIFLLLYLLFFIVPAHADETPDITGVWTAATPGGSFKILSLPDRIEPDCLVFIMLEPGEEEESYGFKVGEVLGALTYNNDNCWTASERFRLPLRAGGGYYMGTTYYCLVGPDLLEFSTDDIAAVYDQYLLQKDAGGIYAAGIWHARIEGISLDIILYPTSNYSWEAILLEIDFDGDTKTLPDIDLSVSDVLYRGFGDPDIDGERCEAWVWGRDSSNDANWLDVQIFLDDYNNLRIEIDRGEEMGTMPIEFNRLY